MLELGLFPDATVPFLTAKLAEPPADAERVNRLIGQLGAKAFADREAASKALLAIGADALPLVRAARAIAAPAEVQSRLDKLLAVIADPGLPANLRRLRAEEVLEKARRKSPS